MSANPSSSEQRLFFGLLSLGALAGCAGYVALVLGTATWAEARTLDAIFPYDGWHIQPFTALALQRLHYALAAAALALAAGWLGLGLGTRSGRGQLVATARAVAQAGRQLGGQWAALAGWQRRVALAGLVGLTVVRGYLSTGYLPYGDDAVSYEFFVRHRLLAVAAYYPMPNNHILANTLSWGFYQVYPSFWVSMRLPVLLTSTVGSGLLFVGLLRWVGFRGALLATGAFSGLQLSLYYASNGRGYWLVILLAGVVFLCLLRLVDTAADAVAGDRAAWVGLLGAGILGCYTVPTFSYVLASAFSWLAVQAVRRRAWGQLGPAVVVGLVVGLSAAVLYVPVLLVSGAKMLVDNDFMQPRSLYDFWRALPEYAWLTEGFLAGQRSIGAVVTVGGLALFGHLWHRAATGRLPAGPALRVRQVGLPALWFMLLPYGLMAVQRVYPPERTLLYKAWFFFLLVALVAENVNWSRRRRWLAGAAAGVFLLYQVGTVVRLNYLGRGANPDQRALYTWLVQHPTTQPVLVPNYGLWLWLRVHAHVQAPTQLWRTEYQVRPGQQYEYVVTQRADPRPAQAGRLVWATSDCLIYSGVVAAGPH
ncbi:MAG: hypothetical protein ACRYFZ_09895 [Janthinobacterium lividum]